MAFHRYYHLTVSFCFVLFGGLTENLVWFVNRLTFKSYFVNICRETPGMPLHEYETEVFDRIQTIAGCAHNIC